MRIDVLHELARAYGGRYAAHRDEADRERACDLARRCIDLEPNHEPSFALLEDLSAARAASSRGRITAVAVVLVAGLAIWAMRAGFHGSPPVRPVSSTPAPPTVAATALPTIAVTEPPTAEPSAPATEAAKGPPEATEEAMAPPRDLPVAFDGGDWAGDLAFEVRRSRAEYGYYRLHGQLLVKGRKEFKRIRLSFALLDEGGRVLAQEAFDGHPNHAPILRPGDTAVFTQLRKAPRGAVRVLCRVVMADGEAGAASYEASRSLEPVWRTRRPAHLKLAVAERVAAFEANSLLKSNSFHGVWELRNTGEAPIRDLRLELRILDDAGAVAAKNSWLVTYGSAPSIRPGETRLAYTYLDTAKPCRRYELAVVEVE